MFIAISAAGVFRTDDGGKTWHPKNTGLSSTSIPDPEADVGHCVHRIAYRLRHHADLRTDLRGGAPKPKEKGGRGGRPS